MHAIAISLVNSLLRSSSDIANIISPVIQPQYSFASTTLLLDPARRGRSDDIDDSRRTAARILLEVCARVFGHGSSPRCQTIDGSFAGFARPPDATHFSSLERHQPCFCIVAGLFDEHILHRIPPGITEPRRQPASGNGGKLQCFGEKFSQ